MTEKQKLINEIREKLTKANLPIEFQLYDFAKVTNAKRFFESHLRELETKDKTKTDLYAKRLKQGLNCVGISLDEIILELKSFQQ